MKATFLSIRIEIKDPTTRKELEEIISLIDGFKLQGARESGPCDLLILEIGEEFQKEFLVNGSSLKKEEVKDIFVTSHRTDPELIIRAFRAGAKEFFSQPLKKDEVRAALEKYRDEKLKSTFSRRKGKIIDLLGSKGGVGTTTVAVNLSTCLVGLDSKPSVALLDINPPLGEVPIFLDMKFSFDWGVLIKNINRADSAFLKRFLGKHSSGIYVLSSATTLDGVIPTGDVLERLFDLLQTTFDYVVIDSGKHLNTTTLNILKNSDRVFIVSVLDLLCLSNTRRLLKIFHDLRFPRKEKIEIIINRFQKESLITLEEAEKSLDRKISWLLPNDYQKTSSAINLGKPLSLMDPKAVLSQNFKELASYLSGKAEKR